jgi:hypothetical protein
MATRPMDTRPKPLTLPLEFDSAATWRTIVRGALIGFAILALLLLIAAIAGKLAVAVQLMLAMLVTFVIARRVRGFPMGAAGTISATEVTTYPESVFGIALAVPVGRFPLSAFRSIVVEERMAINATSVHPYGDVYLVGNGATPRIHVFSGKVDPARAFASELSALMPDPLRSNDSTQRVDVATNGNP